jgi:undecaprenyl-diphosphatase
MGSDLQAGRAPIIRDRVVLSSFVILFLVMAVFARIHPYFPWDPAIYKLVRSISLPGFQSLMIWVSALGAGWVAVGIVVIAGLALLFANLKKEALVCVAGVGLAAAINRGLKFVIARPRPDGSLVEALVPLEHESFPSGHTLFFLELFGFLMLLNLVLARRRIARMVANIVCGAMIVLIGVSRVYLGAHWPSDVLGGYVLGGICLTIMAKSYKRLKNPKLAE